MQKDVQLFISNDPTRYPNCASRLSCDGLDYPVCYRSPRLCLVINGSCFFTGNTMEFIQALLGFGEVLGNYFRHCCVADAAGRH